MTNKCRRTRKKTNNLRDELILGIISASELATVYYYTGRSIRGGSQSTPPGDKACCIIAPIERYSGYRLVRRITKIPPKHGNTTISWLFNYDF